MKRLNSYQQNILLLKDDVGRPKPSTRRLPGNDFTFGKPEIRDPEDAGKGKSIQVHIPFLTFMPFKVASYWQYSKESDLRKQDKDFKRLNKSALGKRATTAHVRFYNCLLTWFNFSVNTCTDRSRTSGYATHLRSETPFRKKLWKSRAQMPWGL